VSQKIYRALSDPTRRRILQLLREGDLQAGELADYFELSKPTLSKHFSILKEAGLIDGEKTGTAIRYSLHVSVLEEALLGLMDFFEIDPSTQSKKSSQSKAHGKRKPPLSS